MQLKGKVTCELNSREVLLTELIFKNVFMDYSPAETAALLSAVVFQQVPIIYFCNLHSCMRGCMHIYIYMHTVLLVYFAGEKPYFCE